MKNFLFGIVLCVSTLCVHAQSDPAASVAETIQQPEVAKHLRFLASDELGGRDTGSPGLAIAARYLAEQFRSYGLDTVPGAAGYFQPVKLVSQQPPPQASMGFGADTFRLGTDLLVISGDSIAEETSVVYANHGTAEDLEKLDVTGKIVVTKTGGEGVTNPQSMYIMSGEKRDRVEKAGAAALVELYRSNQAPWSLLVQYLNVEQLTLGSNSDTAQQKLPILWINDPQGERLKAFEAAKKKQMATLSVDKKISVDVPVKNVVGMLEGTDPELKDEYVVLTAHYDHIGTSPSPNPNDSIFNGARDNAIGTTALLSAAKYLSQNPPARSVLFVALTAEEKGLLGSAWYAEHPLVPLEQTVFNLNTDGAGYDDTTKSDRYWTRADHRARDDRFGRCCF